MDIYIVERYLSIIEVGARGFIAEGKLMRYATTLFAGSTDCLWFLTGQGNRVLESFNDFVRLLRTIFVPFDYELMAGDRMKYFFQSSFCGRLYYQVLEYAIYIYGTLKGKMGYDTNEVGTTC